MSNQKPFILHIKYDPKEKRVDFQLDGPPDEYVNSPLIVEACQAVIGTLGALERQVKAKATETIQ